MQWTKCRMFETCTVYLAGMDTFRAAKHCRSCTQPWRVLLYLRVVCVQTKSPFLSGSRYECSLQRINLRFRCRIQSMDICWRSLWKRNQLHREEMRNIICKLLLVQGYQSCPIRSRNDCEKAQDHLPPSSSVPCRQTLLILCTGPRRTTLVRYLECVLTGFSEPS